MGISDKVPGSMNPPSPLQDKGFNGMSGLHTTTPKVDYAMGKPGQATSPLVNEVDPSMDVKRMDIGPGVSGTINTEKNVNG